MYEIIQILNKEYVNQIYIYKNQLQIIKNNISGTRKKNL